MEQSYSILCIDDEENILSSLKRVLKKENYIVFLANSGQEGLEILRTEKIDLILCDQKMPKMSGFEVLREARKEFPEVMRIMLSGYSDFDSLVKTINEGEIFRFLSKPWEVDELKNVIQLALTQREIICKVKNTLNNVQNINQLIENISVEVAQDQSTILVKVSPKENSCNSEHITQLMDYLVGILGFENNTSKFEMISNRLLKNEETLRFEIVLGKVVTLAVEIKTKEWGPSA